MRSPHTLLLPRLASVPAFVTAQSFAGGTDNIPAMRGMQAATVNLAAVEMAIWSC
jgi:hypothetical protein